MSRVLMTQRAVRRARRSTVRRGLALGAAAGLAAVIVAVGTARWLSTLPAFAIEEVDVRFTRPARHLTRQAVLELARVTPGASLLALDLGLVAERVEAHPWVGRVVARRELPSRLVLEVTERRAALLVQLDRLYFADASGRLIKPVEHGEETDLPVVTGLSAQAVATDPSGTAARLVEALGVLDLADARLPIRVSELHVDPVRGFVLRTAAERTSAGGRLTIVLGDGPFGPKLERAVRVLAYLAAAGEAAERIDLTLGHRAVVKTRSEGRTMARSGARAEGPRSTETSGGGHEL
ncbi:MAG TPA: FtsQ-type POTRA domain-containing protein [Thermodesulfobacteriota bacterium]